MGGVVTTDGRLVFVTHTDANSVAVIDVPTLKHVATIEVGKGPNGVSVTP
jgi:YVTN family beta-propeller protein